MQIITSDMEDFVEDNIFKELQENYDTKDL